MHFPRSSLVAFSNLANSSGFRNFSASMHKRIKFKPYQFDSSMDTVLSNFFVYL